MALKQKEKNDVVLDLGSLGTSEEALNKYVGMFNKEMSLVGTYRKEGQPAKALDHLKIAHQYASKLGALIPAEEENSLMRDYLGKIIENDLACAKLFKRSGDKRASDICFSDAERIVGEMKKYPISKSEEPSRVEKIKMFLEHGTLNESKILQSIIDDERKSVMTETDKYLQKAQEKRQ